MENPFEELNADFTSKRQSIDDQLNSETSKLKDFKIKKIKEIISKARTKIKTIKQQAETREKETKKQYQSQYDILSGDYNEKASLIVMTRLDEDNAHMAKMSDITEKLMGFASSGDIAGVSKFISQNPISSRDIFSYIASDSEGCLLLTPVKHKGYQPHLVKSLDDHVENVVEQNNVHISQKLTYQSDVNTSFPESYLLYVLTTDKEQADALAKDITKKMDQLQPHGFQGAHMTHKVIPVEASVIRYLLKNKPQETSQRENVSDSLTIEEAAKYAGRSTKIIKNLLTRGRIKAEGDLVIKSSIDAYLHKDVKGRLHYQSKDTQERKQEAYSRLQVYTDKELDKHDVANILGISWYGVVILDIEHKKVGKTNIYSVDSIREFIDNHSPTNAGWKKNK